MRVSVVIATLNRGDYLLKCVDELLQAPSRHMLELIVVDQSDRPSSLAHCSDKRLIYTHVNFKSVSRARNHGTAMARGEIVLFLDDDVTGVSRVVDAHAMAHSRTDAPSVTGPILAPGEKLTTVDSLPLKQRAKLHAGELLVSNLDCEYCALFAPGGNASFKKKVLEALGGFDENFIGAALLVGEDAELSHRVKAVGPILYNPAASVVHLQAPSGGTRNDQDRLRHAATGILNIHYFWNKIGYPDRASRAVISCIRTHVLNRRALASLPPWTIIHHVAVLAAAWWQAHQRTARLLVAEPSSAVTQR